METLPVPAQNLIFGDEDGAVFLGEDMPDSAEVAMLRRQGRDERMIGPVAGRLAFKPTDFIQSAGPEASVFREIKTADTD